MWHSTQFSPAVLPRDCGVRIVPADGAAGVEVAEFGPQVQVILIGRDPDWNLWEAGSSDALLKQGKVIFPDQETFTAVGSCHVLLRRQPGGGWIVERQLATDGTDYNYVAVDGRSDVLTLKSGAVMRLGRDDGPALRFEVVQPKGAGALRRLRTKAQQKTVKWWDTHHASMRRVTASLCLLAVTLAGAGFWTLRTDGKLTVAIQRLNEAEAAAKEPPTAFPTSVIKTLREAAYLIVIERDGKRAPLATAWPRSATEMVTNAHVALEVEKNMRRGDRALACPPKPDAPCFEVIGAPRLHPAYLSFKAKLSEAAIGVETMDGKFAASEFPGAYDVAILELEAGASAGPVLEPANVSGLDAGVQIAFAGYLLRDISGSEAAHVTRSPQLHFGTVSAVTNFFGRRVEDNVGAQLVTNTIPVTGGASGGPIVNADGHVVAIVSSGEVVEIPTGSLDEIPRRVPSAAMVNYAQRVDLLEDLVPSGKDYDMAAMERAWEYEFGSFQSHRDYVISTFEKQVRGEDKQPVLLGEPIIEDIVAPFAYDDFKLPLEKGTRYAVLAYASGPHGLTLRVDDGKKLITEEAGRSAQTSFIAEHDGSATVSVLTSPPNESSFELRLYRID